VANKHVRPVAADKLRQVLLDRIVQREQAAFDEQQYGAGGERLGDGGEEEDRVGADSRVWLGGGGWETSIPKATCQHHRVATAQHTSATRVSVDA